ncbi:UrcA family protein [Sphingomonas sp. RB3P16]|uniref:UrcA family protein n=1 Tax=Parasphingomonas frigoris TaxID=3096163 RepID=UPI002FCAE9FD
MSPFSVGVCILAVSAQASAAPLKLSPSQTSIERVSFADLDLLGQAGKATLQRRIRAAARRVCDTQGVPSLAVKLDAMRCNRRAIARAAAQIDRIAAAHATKAVEIAYLSVDAGR